MNRGHVLQQSSPVQQMMAGSPNWFNMMGNMKPPPPTPPSVQQPSACLFPQNSFLFPQYMPPAAWQENHEDLPESWSQLLLGGMVGDQEEKPGLSPIIQAAKKMENWEEQLVLHQEASNGGAAAEVKQENSSSSSTYVYGHGNAVVDCEVGKPANWSQMMAASSPKSCVTSLSSNMLDFSNNKADGRHPPPDRTSECNSTATGGALKKARVQPSSTQSFKMILELSSSQPQKKNLQNGMVRKEKLGDRITALHQLVSPFGKTDTASVLLEAIGYIRFLQSQVEALSLPYLGNGPGNTRPQRSIQGEKNSLFPEDPGQLVNANCIKRKGASEQESGEEAKKDLRSRGLCLVPISCTMQVGSDNGADYWAPTFGGGFR